MLKTSNSQRVNSRIRQTPAAKHLLSEAFAAQATLRPQLESVKSDDSTMKNIFFRMLPISTKLQKAEIASRHTKTATTTKGSNIGRAPLRSEMHTFFENAHRSAAKCWDP